MNDIKGDRLYVSLGASQVRRRLKGFGHEASTIVSNRVFRESMCHASLNERNSANDEPMLDKSASLHVGGEMGDNARDWCKKT